MSQSASSLLHEAFKTLGFRMWSIKKKKKPLRQGKNRVKCFVFSTAVRPPVPHIIQSNATTVLIISMKKFIKYIYIVYLRTALRNIITIRIILRRELERTTKSLRVKTSSVCVRNNIPLCHCAQCLCAPPI